MFGTMYKKIKKVITGDRRGENLKYLVKYQEEIKEINYSKVMKILLRSDSKIFKKKDGEWNIAKVAEHTYLDRRTAKKYINLYIENTK